MNVDFSIMVDPPWVIGLRFIIVKTVHRCVFAPRWVANGYRLQTILKETKALLAQHGVMQKRQS